MNCYPFTTSFVLAPFAFICNALAPSPYSAHMPGVRSQSCETQDTCISRQLGKVLAGRQSSLEEVSMLSEKSKNRECVIIGNNQQR